MRSFLCPMEIIVVFSLVQTISCSVFESNDSFSTFLVQRGSRSECSHAAAKEEMPPRGTLDTGEGGS